MSKQSEVPVVTQTSLRRKLLSVLPRHAIDRLTDRLDPHLANKADLIDELILNWDAEGVGQELLKLVKKADGQ